MVLSNLQGQKTVTLDAGKQLVVTASALSSGHVAQLGQKAGDANQGFTTIAAGSGNTTFGPFTLPQRFSITSNAGLLTSVVNLVDYFAPEEAATAAQGTLADSAQQPQIEVAITTATIALTNVLHANNLAVIDRAAGCTATLPPATGSGDKYTVINKTLITTNDLIILVTTTDIMKGGVTVKQDGGDTNLSFECAADTDTITMNGAETGGLAGDKFVFEDTAAGEWTIEGDTAATGTEVTPFSAGVS